MNQEPVRQLVVWCPNWPVVTIGVAPGTSVAVLRGQDVLAVSRAAAEEGVQPGMRRRAAQACCPSLVLAEHDPARDSRHFEPVVRSLQELVASSEVDEPGTVLFATLGPSRWCGGDAALAQRTHQLVLAALGERAELLEGVGIGIADGRFAAMVAARRNVSQPQVVPPGPEATSAALAGVSVTALRTIADVAPELVDLLQRLGLHTLGSLAALPATDVLARFGLEGAFAHRLACGLDSRRPDAVEPSPELTVEMSFEDPVELLGPLVFAAKHLSEELHQRLAQLGQVCTRLLVEAESDHGERSERRWHRSTGLSAAAMVERVRWQLEGWVDAPGALTGGVVLLRLVPEEAEADKGRQLGFWGEATQADEFAARTVARLSGLLGPEAVTVAEWHGGRHPTDRYRWVAAAGADLDAASRRSALAAPVAHPWPGSLGTPSPAWVAATPEPLDVLDRAGATVTVDGRGAVSGDPAVVVIRNRAEPVQGWAGPWPAEERWWDPQRRRRRARFQLLTERGEALLVSLERGRWWLECKYE